MNTNANLQAVGPTGIVGPWIWNLYVELQHLKAIAGQSDTLLCRMWSTWVTGPRGLSSTCDHRKRVQIVYYWPQMGSEIGSRGMT